MRARPVEVRRVVFALQRRGYRFEQDERGVRVRGPHPLGQRLSALLKERAEEVRAVLREDRRPS